MCVLYKSYITHICKVYMPQKSNGLRLKSAKLIWDQVAFLAAFHTIIRCTSKKTYLNYSER